MNKSSFKLSLLLGMALYCIGCHSAASNLARGPSPAAIESESGVDAGLDRMHLAEARWQADLGNDHIARKAYTSVLNKNSGSAEAIVGLARLDLAAGRIEEAEQGFMTGLAIAPDDPVILTAVAQFYLSQEQWRDAIVTLQKAIQLAPHDGVARHHLAVALAKSGQEQLALEYFRSIVSESEAYYNLALIQYEKDEILDCERHLMHAVLLDPNLQAAQTWLTDVRQERVDRQLPEPQPIGHAGRDVRITPATSTVEKPRVPTHPVQVVKPTPQVARINDKTTVATSHPSESIRISPTRPPQKTLEEMVSEAKPVSLARMESAVDHSPPRKVKTNRQPPEEVLRISGIGTAPPPLVDAPIVPLPNEGGYRRNAQPPRPLRKTISDSQREQWENQLRNRNKVSR